MTQHKSKFQSWTSEQETFQDTEEAEWVEDDEGEEGWEDEEEEMSHTQQPRNGSPAGGAYRGFRRRRRPAFATNGSRRPMSTPPSSAPLKQSRPSPRPRVEPPLIVREDVVNTFFHLALFIGKYSSNVFCRALHYFSYPLALALFLWMLVYLMAKMHHTFRSAIAPLCILPGVSRFHLCLPEPVNPGVDYPRLVETESKTFEHLLDDFVTGSALSLQVKHAEMATTDLITLVRISDLKAKNSLADSLIDFVRDAKKTGRSLQTLSSKVGGAVDSIMAVNEFALKSIESARANEPSPWSYAALAPWVSKPKKATNEVIKETFEEAMNVLSNHLERLILEAEASDKHLNDLEEHLATLHELVAREDSSISAAKDDLLAELWSKLGGNRKQLRNFESHLGLLQDLEEYRQQARLHVTAALQMLRGLGGDMEDMRERVVAPDLLGPSIPVEVHLKSIEMGLERLKEGRIRAKRLEEEAVRRVLGSSV